MRKYLRQYKWKNIFAMLKNQKKDPKRCEKKFTDKLVVVTGATSGIGFATVEKYASMGANIITVNRNEEKSIKLCDEITNKYNVECSYMLADFSRLEDVHRVAMKLRDLDQKIDVLIHNAGTYMTKKAFTKDEMEMVFQTNYLSTFILNYILKDKLINQKEGRILFVNSEAHRFAVWGMHLDDLHWKKHRYSGLRSYASAKMAQLLSMLKFNEIFDGTGVTINAMHPGNIKTNSGSSNGKIYKWYKRNFIDRKARPVEISSEALYYLGVSEDINGVSGKFYNLTTDEIPAPPALDMEEANKLWELSLEMGNIDEK